MEHQPPLELMRLMVMLLAEDMLLTLSELSTLLREKLMLSLRLMLMPFMVSTHMVTTTLDSHPTLGQLFPAIQDQLSQAIPLQLLPEQLEYGRERLRLSQRLMPFMEST